MLVRTAWILPLLIAVPAMPQDAVAILPDQLPGLSFGEERHLERLVARDQESILKGGNRGPGTRACCWTRFEQTGDLKMPPGRKLNDEQIATIEKWVATGMPMPDSAAEGEATRRGSLGLSAAEAIPPNRR